MYTQSKTPINFVSNLFKSGEKNATFLISAFELFVDIANPIKNRPCGWFCKSWLRSVDLNHRPSGYEPDELPGCSTPRQCKRDYISFLHNVK